MGRSLYFILYFMLVFDILCIVDLNNFSWITHVRKLRVFKHVKWAKSCFFYQRKIGKKFVTWKKILLIGKKIQKCCLYRRILFTAFRYVVFQINSQIRTSSSFYHGFHACLKKNRICTLGRRHFYLARFDELVCGALNLRLVLQISHSIKTPPSIPRCIIHYYLYMQLQNYMFD